MCYHMQHVLRTQFLRDRVVVTLNSLCSPRWPQAYGELPSSLGLTLWDKHTTTSASEMMSYNGN